MGQEVPPVTRRRVLTLMGGSIVASGSVAGVATGQTNIIQQIQRKGQWMVTPGTDDPTGWSSTHRSFQRPLTLTSPAGGEASARPRDGSVELSIDVHEDDEFGAASVGIGRWTLGEIENIAVESSGSPIGINLNLDMNSDDEMYEWEDVGGNIDEWIGFGGDDTAVVVDWEAGDRTISATDEVYWVMGTSDEGDDLDNSPDSPVSINGMAEAFGNDVPVNVVVGVRGGDLVPEPSNVLALVHSVDVSTS